MSDRRDRGPIGRQSQFRQDRMENYLERGSTQKHKRSLVIIAGVLVFALVVGPFAMALFG